MCNMTVNSREVAPQEYQRMGKFVKVLDVKHGTYTEETTAEPEQAIAETTQDAEPKNTNDKSHTALQEGLNPTRVFYKGEWRVLVLFLPIKCGHDFADRCEIKALPERNYEDIATSLENGKNGFSEWYLYDPETTCKRLKRYQDTAMKKFTAKTGVQVLEAELNHPERKAVETEKNAPRRPKSVHKDIQEEPSTASMQCGEIEVKASTPEQVKYISMIQSVEQMGKTRYMFTVSDDFCVELIICEHDLENKNDLMNHWYQHGYVKERNATHMGLHCYYTDFDGNCYGRYNHTEKKGKLNFEWVLPYTPENLGKLLAEAIKRYDDDSELVIVDVSSEFPHIYTIVKSGENWIESINSAYKDAHESAEICRQHMKNHPDNADYWKARVEEYERVYYRAMRYSDFERIQRERILKQPLHEVTEQDYEEMLDVLPPLHWVEINGVSEFCMMEMYTGCYTNQYAHDKKTGKYYQKLVDATDRDTWIHKLLEKGVA